MDAYYPNAVAPYPANGAPYQPAKRHQYPSLLCALFTHLVLFVTIFLCFMYILHWENPVTGSTDAWQFNWHPILMVSAFVLCMGEALMAFRLLPFDHRTQKVIHLSMQTFALAASSVGIYAIIAFHKSNGTPHFYNIHGLLGLIGWCLFCVQYLIGFFSFCFPRLPDGPRAKTMAYHKYIGIVLFFLLWAAMLTGLMDRERIQFKTTGGPTYRIANALGCMIALSAAVILSHLAPPQTKEQKAVDMHERLLP